MLEAAGRLLSMYIEPGENFDGTMRAYQLMRKCNPIHFSILSHHENLCLLKYTPDRSLIVFVLVQVKNYDNFLINWTDNLAHRTRLNLEELGATTLIGFMEGQGYLIYEIETVWLNPSWRNKGFGQGMYKAAYMYSKNGIQSSVDLGELSLAVWLSLYNKHKSIFIELATGHKIPRDSVTISGLTIKCKIKNRIIELTSSKTPDFKFVWQKE